MSLLDRMKGMARGKQGAPEETPAHAYGDIDLPLNPMEATVRGVHTAFSCVGTAMK